MSAKNPALFFKTKEQLFDAKEDYERIGFKVTYDLKDLTLHVYQDNSHSRKYKARQAREEAKRAAYDEQYQDKY